MQVTHHLGILSLNKNVNEDVGFLLTNKKGSYCSFFNTPSSRYHGLFYFDTATMNMYKFIESIEIAGHGKAESLKNGFYFAERKKHGITESFMMPMHSNSLLYELSGENEIDIVMDCKNSYDNREWGRDYDILEAGGCLIVKFTKKTDRREDLSDGEGEFVLYLAIKSSNGYYEKNDKWIEREYYYDKERNSKPYKRHVYNALRLKGSKFVFSMSKRRDSAIKECINIFNNANDIKNREKENFFALLKNERVKKIISNEKINQGTRVAYVNAVNSLNNLIADDKNVIAGLPWFYQFWSRDALISLKALHNIDGVLAKKLLFSYLDKIGDDGRLPNLIGQHGSGNSGSADAVGWLFFRCNDMAENINNQKAAINSIKKSMHAIKQNRHSGNEKIKEYLKKCSLIISKKENEYNKTLYELESSLEKSISGLLKSHTKDSFDFSLPKETWMDTDFSGDGRQGMRIELQALRLSMYRLMFELTQNHKYKALENILRTKTKNKFWDGKILADGLDDFTIRPNLFIAAYIYPELLSPDEWQACFENALKCLWLEWGGLSTIDKNSPMYTEASTGEHTKSYHRGDSWFWINNLAAITLKKINQKKFDKNIQKIINAGTEEILWKGCIGCHSELSSAKELRSQGCWSQAWSNAMFIEMVDELFG